MATISFFLKKKTGDNTADWKHLAVSIPMLLSLGIAGRVLYVYILFILL